MRSAAARGRKWSQTTMNRPVRVVWDHLL
jgi:hypothetical protein